MHALMFQAPSNISIAGGQLCCFLAFRLLKFLPKSLVECATISLSILSTLEPVVFAAV